MPIASPAVAVTPLRLITYNILADALCMTSKHSYCDAAERSWGDASAGRCQRLLAEILSYDADVVCLQECNTRCFDEFCCEMGDGTGGAPAATSEERRIYAGFHHSSFLSSASDAAAARESETGLAVFVRSSAWRPAAIKAHRLGSLDDAHRHSGRLAQKLRDQSDSLLLLLLQHTASGARVVIGNTHLHWDPRWPHLKASQGELAARCLDEFASSTGRGTTAARRAGGRAGPVAAPSLLPSVVLAGDFNSVPVLQPSFLRAEAQAALPSPLPPSWQASALYRLLSTGSVPPDHPEHPTAFEAKHDVQSSPVQSSQGKARQGKASQGKAEPDVQAGGGAAAASTGAAERHRKKRAKTAAACKPPLGPLTTRLQLRDSHAHALSAGPLPLTTHADDFAGCIDYIFVSDCRGAAADGGMGSSAAAEAPPSSDCPVAALPAAAGMPSGGADLSSSGGADLSSSSRQRHPRVEVLEVLAMPYDLERPGAFGKVPSAEWPSDHLCLGALLGIPQAE